MGSRIRSILCRQWELVVALGERRRGATIQQLMEAVGASRATTYRDLKFLVESGVPIHHERVNGEVRYRLHGPPLPPLRPTALQLAALHLARRMLDALEGTRLVQELDALLARLAPGAGDPADPAIELGERAPPRQPTRVQVIDEAIATGRRIQFQYHAAHRDAPEPRRADPVAFRHLHDHLYLIAWDLDRVDWRVFKLPRIGEVQVLDEPADAHPAYDEQALFAHSARIWSGDPVSVAVRLKPAVARFAAEWPLAAHQTIEPRADGSVVIRAEVAGTIEALRWVLSWGRNAEALAPPELREAVATELHAALAAYPSHGS